MSGIWWDRSATIGETPTLGHDPLLHNNVDATTDIVPDLATTGGVRRQRDVPVPVELTYLFRVPTQVRAPRSIGTEQRHPLIGSSRQRAVDQAILCAARLTRRAADPSLGQDTECRANQDSQFTHSYDTVRVLADAQQSSQVTAERARTAQHAAQKNESYCF